MNLPTRITISRILALPVVMLLFYLCFPYHYIAAAAVFAIAASTDMIDGRLARKRNEVTSLGKLLDPIADKVLACSVLIMEAACGDAMMLFNPPVGVIFTTVIVGREILIGAFRMLAARKGVILAADHLGKLKTIFLNVSLPVMMLSELHIYIKIVGNVLFAVAFLFTVISGAHYVIANRKVLSEEDEKNA